MIKNIKWLLLVSLTFIACNESNDDVVVNNTSDGLPLTAGSANFSKYVSLGNSLTAGYSDGALFIEGQKGSYPNILSQQFSLVGGGEFKIPFMADNVGGLLLGGTPIATPRLYFNGSAPTPVSGTPSTVATTVLTGGFNNMGVPGAKSFHLLSNSYGNPAGIGTYSNPYFVRFASATSATIVGDAVAQNPTFFSLWIGNNDVLSYATSGGTGVNQTGTSILPQNYGGNDITDPTVFASVYNSIVTNLTAGGAKGVVANIPYVTSVPFFTRVLPNALPGLPTANTTQLNQLFGGINAALAGAGLPPRFVTLVADDGNAATSETNPLLIIDQVLPNISAQITAALTPSLGLPTATFLGGLYGQARHARKTVGDRDYILLTTAGLISPPNNIQTTGTVVPFNVRGVSYPLQDAAVLTAAETAEVKIATDAYNTTIQAIATSKGLAFVNANAVLNQVANGGVSGNGYNLTSEYVTGGAFSLDGVHPSPRGYALIANKFLEAINTTYGSNFKGVSFADYRILFPSML